MSGHGQASVSMQRVSSEAAIPAVTALAAGAVLFILASGPVRAADGLSIELGQSTSSFTDVQVVRLGARRNWTAQPIPTGRWQLGGHWDLSAGLWHNQSDPRIRMSNEVVELSLTPTLRWQSGVPGAVMPFIDAGLGVHLVSDDTITTLRDLSGHVLFGSVLGAGIRVGARGEYEIGYRVQHLSNGGIRQPNNGINLQSIRLHYHF